MVVMGKKRGLMFEGRVSSSAKEFIVTRGGAVGGVVGVIVVGCAVGIFLSVCNGLFSLFMSLLAKLNSNAVSA